MRRTATILIVAASLVAAFLPLSTWASQGLAGRANKPTALAKVRYIYKGLSVTPPHKKTRKGKKGQSLYSAYFLHTAKKQKASLGFRDGSLLHLNQQTDAVLRSANLTYVKKGQVEQVVQPGSNHQVQTAGALASAIGTKFLVRQKKKTTTVIVVEGSVLVKNKFGSVTVTTNEETTVKQGKKPSAPKPVDAQSAASWADSIPMPSNPPGQNIALRANGGNVAAASSEAPAFATHRSGLPRPAAAASDGKASNINDGRLNTSWQTRTEATTNQWVKVGFAGAGSQSYRITGIVLDCAATNGQSMDNAMKDFDFRVSNTDTRDASFQTVLSATCQQTTKLQKWAFQKLYPARYAELYAKNNYGSRKAIAVTELEVISSNEPVALGSPTPLPTGTPTSIAPTPTNTSISAPTNTPVPTATMTSVVPTKHTWSFSLSFATETDSDGNTADYSVTASVCAADPANQTWTGSLHEVFNGTPNDIALSPPWYSAPNTPQTVSTGGDGRYLQLTYLPTGPQVRAYINFGQTTFVPHDQTKLASITEGAAC